MRLDRQVVSTALSRFERRAIPSPEGKRSAVSILLVPGEGTGDLAVVLTRRSAQLRTHKGQWALPGGRLDSGEGPREAALRECAEEIGIRPEPEDIVGELDDFATRSGFCITPEVVWAADAPFAPDINPAEVASVHVVSVRDLDVEPSFSKIPESNRPVFKMPFLGGYIHAPTGAIVHQFAEVVLHGRSTRVFDYEEPTFAWK